MLRESGVKRVVDVRLNNGSQLSGFAKQDDLAWFLDEICDIDYVHVPSLAPTRELPKRLPERSNRLDRLRCRLSGADA